MEVHLLGHGGVVPLVVGELLQQAVQSVHRSEQQPVLRLVLNKSKIKNKQIHREVKTNPGECDLQEDGEDLGGVELVVVEGDLHLQLPHQPGHEPLG